MNPSDANKNSRFWVQEAVCWFRGSGARLDPLMIHKELSCRGPGKLSQRTSPGYNSCLWPCNKISPHLAAQHSTQGLRSEITEQLAGCCRLRLSRKGCHPRKARTSASKELTTGLAAGGRGSLAWEALLEQLASRKASDERPTEGEKREGGRDRNRDGEKRERKLDRDKGRERQGERRSFVTWSQCQTPPCPPYSVCETVSSSHSRGRKLSPPPERKTIKEFVDLFLKLPQGVNWAASERVRKLEKAPGGGRPRCLHSRSAGRSAAQGAGATVGTTAPGHGRGVGSSAPVPARGHSHGLTGLRDYAIFQLPEFSFFSPPECSRIKPDHQIVRKWFRCASLKT